MSQEQAYEIAVRSFQHEHNRWIQNAVVLFGVLMSLLLFHSRLSILPTWLVLPIAIAISAMTVYVSLTIRGSTDAWRETVRHVEHGDDILPFEFCDNWLERYTAHKGQWRDFCDIVCGCRKRKLGWLRWKRQVLFSVTRLYTLMAFTAAVMFGILFVIKVMCGVFCSLSACSLSARL